MKTIWHRSGLIAKNSFEALQNDKADKEGEQGKIVLVKETTKDGQKDATIQKNINPDGKEKNGQEKGTNSNVASNMNDKVQISSDKSQKTPSQSPHSQSQASENKGKTSRTKGRQNNSGMGRLTGGEKKGIIGDLFGETSSVASGNDQGSMEGKDDSDKPKNDPCKVKQSLEDEDIDNNIQQISTAGDLSPRQVGHLKT